MIWIGTSGYNYPELEGQLYPGDLSICEDAGRITRPGFQRSRSTTPFYRMPNEKLVGGWAAQTPSPYKRR